MAIAYAVAHCVVFTTQTKNLAVVSGYVQALLFTLSLFFYYLTLDVPQSTPSDTADKANWDLHTRKQTTVNVCRSEAFSLREPVCVTSAEFSSLQPASDPAAAVMSLAHDLLRAALPYWPPVYCSVNSICWV